MKHLLRLLAPSLLLVGHSAAAQGTWENQPGTLYNHYGAPRVLVAAGPSTFWELYEKYSMQRNGTAHEVVSSSDNGQTTVSQYVSSVDTDGSGAIANDLSALDSQTAWVITSNVAGRVGTASCSLLYTTSGPAGFSKKSTPLPLNSYKVHFFTAQRGIILALPDAGATMWPIYQTNDGGDSWQLVANPPALVGGAYYVLAKFGIGNSLWFTTNTHDALHTSDQGAIWVTTPALGRVAFEDEQHGLAFDSTISRGQQLLRTADGGRTWTTVAFSGPPIPPNTAMTAIPGQPGTYWRVSSQGHRSPNTSFYYAFDGITAISHDSGAHWAALPTQNIDFVSIIATGNGQPWAGIVDDAGVTPTHYTAIQRFTEGVLAARPATSTGPACYPNPTSGLVHVAGPLPAALDVRVYNALGQLCHHGLLGSAAPTVDLTNLPDGLYQLVLYNAEVVVNSQRILKHAN